MMNESFRVLNEGGTGLANSSIVTSDLGRPSTSDNASNTSVDDLSSFKDIISDEVQYYIDTTVAIPLCSVISSFGIIANIINIIVFLNQDLKNNVSVSMFFLAWSDLGMCLSTFVATISYGIHAHNSTDQAGYMSPHYIAGSWVRGLFYSISSWVTLFSSIERCLCVAMPFKIKAILTRARMVTILIFIFVICFLMFLPAYISMSLQRFLPADQKKNPPNVVASWFLTWNKLLQDTASSFTGIFSPTVTQVLIIITSYVMTKSLRMAASFRSANSNNRERSQNVISSKDRVLVKMVFIISVIFMTCNIPVMLFVYGRRLVVGLDFTGSLRNLHATFLWIAFLCGAVNSSVNIFLYYRVSSLFRVTFTNIFHCRRRQNGQPNESSSQPAGSDGSLNDRKY